MDFIRRFMAGRHGMDALSMAISLASLLLMMVSSFFRLWWLEVAALLLLGWGLFRILSRNHVKRQAENMRFLQLWNRLRAWWASLRGKVKENKTHVHVRCKACGQTMRVPRGKGRIRITCPKCKAVIEKKT